MLRLFEGFMEVVKVFIESLSKLIKEELGPGYTTQNVHLSDDPGSQEARDQYQQYLEDQ